MSTITKYCWGLGDSLMKILSMAAFPQTTHKKQPITLLSPHVNDATDIKQDWGGSDASPLVWGDSATELLLEASHPELPRSSRCLAPTGSIAQHRLQTKDWVKGAASSWESSASTIFCLLCFSSKRDEAVPSVDSSSCLIGGGEEKGVCLIQARWWQLSLSPLGVEPTVSNLYEWEAVHQPQEP